MRQSPLFSGIVYILLGILFTYFAVGNVRSEGWGFFSYLLVILATFDLGAGIRMIGFHYKLKRNIKK
ncbi:YdiK family protein [Bacillus sp. B-jedd]|uniref:YdiK family protein n=1 Tax=Bacillus sp. B-jedd TaxID=1476857 RepID=UPI0005155E69|nr:YdiK family protein [Bacillus sp. B-jedd]CEG25383.1 putative lipoprotein [Bacillus sp. B-jedd]